MKALTLYKSKSSWLLAAMFVALACLAYPQKSLAADTEVTCHAPVVVVWATGGGPFPRPQVTIDCTGGSSAGIQFFAYPLAAAPGLSFNANFANSIPVLVGNLVLVHGPGTDITLTSDLSNTSGNNWGCGSANCRILDQVFGY